MSCVGCVRGMTIVCVCMCLCVISGVVFSGDVCGCVVFICVRLCTGGACAHVRLCETQRLTLGVYFNVSLPYFVVHSLLNLCSLTGP